MPDKADTVHRERWEKKKKKDLLYLFFVVPVLARVVIRRFGGRGMDGGVDWNVGGNESVKVRKENAKGEVARAIFLSLSIGQP